MVVQRVVQHHVTMFQCRRLAKGKSDRGHLSEGVSYQFNHEKSESLIISFRKSSEDCQVT
jgi:hypothetical protein